MTVAIAFVAISALAVQTSAEQSLCFFSPSDLPPPAEISDTRCADFRNMGTTEITIFGCGCDALAFFSGFFKACGPCPLYTGGVTFKCATGSGVGGDVVSWPPAGFPAPLVGSFFSIAASNCATNCDDSLTIEVNTHCECTDSSGATSYCQSFENAFAWTGNCRMPCIDGDMLDMIQGEVEGEGEEEQSGQGE